MSERDLEDLLDRVPVPAYDARDDVARGVARLRRRNVSISAAGLVLAATVGTTLMLQGPSSPASSPPYAGEPSAVTPSAQPVPEPSASMTGGVGPVETVGPARRFPFAQTQETLRAWRDVLAEHLGSGVRFARNQQTGGDALGTKLDWAGGGMLQVMVGSRWDDIAGFTGTDPAQSRRVIFRGLQARTWTDGSDLLASVRHEDGTVVSLYASTSFGNNGTSTPSLDLTQRQLLEAAADPRLRLPD